MEQNLTLSDDLRRYLGLLWNWAWLLILVTVIGGGIAYFVTSRETPLYQASTTLLINQAPGLSNNPYSDIVTSERLASTYSELLTKRPVLEGVEQRLGLAPGDVHPKNITVRQQQSTQLINVSVTDTNPERAAQIANALGVVFAEQNQALQASRYAESKSSLSDQLVNVDRQVQETTLALEALNEDPENAEEKGRLQTQLASYRELYTNLLQQYVLADITPQSESTLAPGEEPPLTKEEIAAQLARVDELITQTNQALGDPGGSTETGLERDRLQTNLALYRQVYASLLQSFEQVRLAEIQSSSNLVQVEPAIVPTTPIGPNVTQNTLLAAAVGLMLAGGLVFLIEALDDTVKGPDDVTRHLGLPILGLIAQIDDQMDVDGPLAALHPRSPLAEAFRVLRTNIQYASVDKPINTLLVTSPSPKDGKSTISANLAVVMAQSGRQVALLDADLRRPSVHKKLLLSNRRGLSDLFVQPQVHLEGALRRSKFSGLFAISSGGLPPNPSELVGSEKMNEIIRKLHEEVDLIVIDTPPITAVTDAAVLAPRVDGVVLVLRPGDTKLALAKQAVEQLLRGGANVLGVVLNDADNRQSRYRYYYSGYYAYYNSYYYGDPADPQKSSKQKPQPGGTN